LSLCEAVTQADINDWTDVFFGSGKRSGYVCVTDFRSQWFYGSTDIGRLVRDTAHKEKQFISINAFKVNWKDKVFSRKTEYLQQIRNIAIDVDQYKLDLSIEQGLDIIQSLVVENKLPEPNLVLTSRGIQLFYSIDGGASPKLSWWTQYITEQFVTKLFEVGADSNAKDLSRVMRVPYSVNERNGSLVKPDIWNDTSYSLQELYKYCKPIDSTKARKQTKRNNVVIDFNKGMIRYFRTNNARLKDFNKLIELRGGNFTGMRNVFLYVYSYHRALMVKDKEVLLNMMRDVFKDVYTTDRKAKPMRDSEFKTTVYSAYKDAMKYFEHYKDNNYQLFYGTNDGIIKPYKTSNLIEKLNITLQEQQELSVLCNESIKRDKRNQQELERIEAKRREQGMKSMDDYNTTRQAKKDKLKADVLKLKERGLSNGAISEKLEISKRHVRRLIKEVS
jgi:hypothetical protein